MAWRFIRRDHAPRGYRFAYNSVSYGNLRSFLYAVLNHGSRRNLRRTPRGVRPGAVAGGIWLAKWVDDA